MNAGEYYNRQVAEMVGDEVVVAHSDAALGEAAARTEIGIA
jgi:hypothetical protein